MLNYGMVAWYNCLSIRLQNEMEKTKKEVSANCEKQYNLYKRSKSLYSEKLGAMTNSTRILVPGYSCYD